MDELELANRFDGERPRLRSVAYRIVGSLCAADDAVQEAWLRLQRTETDEIDNLEGWLTTVVARICLNILRNRRSHPEQPLDAFAPEPIISTDAREDPEHEALLANAVGIALQVVLDALTRQNAWRSCCTTCSPSRSTRSPSWSNARLRRPGSMPAELDAGSADPDVVARAHGRTGVLEQHGAEKVARAAMMARRFAPFVRPFAALAFTVVGDRGVTIDILNDRELIPRLVRSGGSPAG
jgi:hypothetical protein